MTDDDIWIDDPTSSHYNRWIRGKTDAKSFERMRSDDDQQYAAGAVVEYNTDPVIPGRGSAIFLHCWGDPQTPTSGCIALARDDLLRLLAWLDRAQQPRIALMVADEAPSSRQRP
jgi:L,D-peptidoglycan transpeptidase YkuD (ErfK/YbiS/YcfS/YnhG family)